MVLIRTYNELLNHINPPIAKSLREIFPYETIISPPARFSELRGLLKRF